MRGGVWQRVRERGGWHWWSEHEPGRSGPPGGGGSPHPTSTRPMTLTRRRHADDRPGAPCAHRVRRDQSLSEHDLPELHAHIRSPSPVPGHARPHRHLHRHVVCICRCVDEADRGPGEGMRSARRGTGFTRADRVDRGETSRSAWFLRVEHHPASLRPGAVHPYRQGDRPWDGTGQHPGEDGGQHLYHRPSRAATVER